MKKAVCLLSGGLDSTAVLYLARSEDWEVTALTVDYGQLHLKEIEFAAQTAARFSLKHYQVRTQLPWGGSSLIDPNLPLPSGRDVEQMSKDIPSSYVPARNSILLSYAASCAEAEKAEAIMIGANILDYSGYPDCRPDFFEAFEKVIALGTKSGVEGRRLTISAPLITLGKKEIVLLGRRLGVPFEETWSCYRGLSRPCQNCDSCRLRAKGFNEAGVIDPLIEYAASANR